MRETIQSFLSPHSSFFEPAKLGSLGAFTFGFLQALTLSLYPALAQALKIDVSLIVGIFAFGSVFFLVAPQYWGRRSDGLGRARVIGINLMGLGISFALVAMLVSFEFNRSLSFAGLLLARLVYGLFASGLVAVSLAWWHDKSENPTQGQLSHSLALNVGRILAPSLVWALSAHLSVVFGLSALWCLILGGVALTKAPGAQKTCSEKLRPSTGLLPSLLLATAYIGLFQSMLASTLQESFSLSATASAELMAKVLVAVGILTVAWQLLGKKLAHASLNLVLRVSLIAWIMAALLIFEIKSTTQLGFVALLLSVGIAFITPLLLAREKINGALSGQLATTQTFGLLVGSLAGALGLQLGLSLGMVAGVLALVLLAFTFNERSIT